MIVQFGFAFIRIAFYFFFNIIRLLLDRFEDPRYGCTATKIRIILFHFIYYILGLLLIYFQHSNGNICL